jgi:Uma2 family endonuclease
MSAIARHARYTIQDYVRLEEYSNVKHEYVDGQIYAMAGGTPAHAAIAARVSAALIAQLRGKPCNVYSSDLRVRIVATGLDTYPDVSVVCGGEEHDREDPNAVTNPVVLVEVLSPATEEYDRAEKLEHYKRIPACVEVVLVAHDKPRVEVWRRAPGSWVRDAAEVGQTLRLASIDCLLDVDEIYRDPFATRSA